MSIGVRLRLPERHQPGPREHGLGLILDAVFAEIGAAASETAAQGFLVACGKRLARAIDVSDVRDLDDLAARANGLWAQSGLGEVRFVVAPKGIRVVHAGAAPDFPAQLADCLPALLQGAYDTWFRALGSGPHLTTRLVSRSADLVELFHGG